MSECFVHFKLVSGKVELQCVSNNNTHGLPISEVLCTTDDLTFLSFFLK